VQECFEAKNSISGVPGITESWRVSAGPRESRCAVRCRAEAGKPLLGERTA
jgi:hypothetical protein